MSYDKQRCPIAIAVGSWSKLTSRKHNWQTIDTPPRNELHRTTASYCRLRQGICTQLGEGSWQKKLQKRQPPQRWSVILVPWVKTSVCRLAQAGEDKRENSQSSVLRGGASPSFKSKWLRSMEFRYFKGVQKGKLHRCFRDKHVVVSVPFRVVESPDVFYHATHPDMSISFDFTSN